jgi:hypothetical protein
MNVQSVITLEQAQNEIDALQRRLAEYASEVQRLREQGRDCYVDADSKSTLNALEECRTERDKLKEGAKKITEAARRALTDFDILICRGDIADEPRAHQTRNILRNAVDTARELGLLEDK